MKQQEQGDRQKGMRRSEWMLRLLAVSLTFSHVSAAPWTYGECNPDGQPASCCIWSGDSNGASMHSRKPLTETVRLQCVKAPEAVIDRRPAWHVSRSASRTQWQLP